MHTKYGDYHLSIYYSRLCYTDGQLLQHCIRISSADPALSHSYSLYLSFSLSLFLSIYLSISLSLSRFLSPSLSPSLSPPLSLSLSLSLSLALNMIYSSLYFVLQDTMAHSHCDKHSIHFSRLVLVMDSMTPTASPNRS